MGKLTLKKLIQNLILLFISCLFVVVILEAALRIMKDDKYYVWDPYLKVTFKPLPQLFPGIIGESHYYVNSEGFRAEEIPEVVKLKIITLGGSTTECVYLDQKEAWPYLLQKNLSEQLNNPVWVGNAGKRGMTTYEHIVQTSILLKQYPDIDLILILPGVNDLQRRFGSKNNYKPKKLNQDVYLKAFDRTPDYNPNFPFYKKTELWRSLSKLRYLFIDAKSQLDSEGEILQKWRQNRKAAKMILNELLDLEQSLNDYEKNLLKIIDIANQHNVRLVFITQPVIWYKGMPKELEDLCWFGGVGNYQNEKGKEYFSIEVLEKGMRLYNARLRKICKEKNIFLVDLEDKLPKDTTVYYDDCHYNENGSRIVAELISAEVEKILK